MEQPPSQKNSQKQKHTKPPKPNQTTTNPKNTPQKNYQTNKTKKTTTTKKKSPFLPICWKSSEWKMDYSIIASAVHSQNRSVMSCGTGTANGSCAAGNVCWAPSLPYKYTSYMQLK